MNNADPRQPAGLPLPDAQKSGVMPPNVDIDSSRRRFVGKGLAVPAVLTVASTPLMAAGQTGCLSASASTSLQASAVARQAINGVLSCAGSSPSSWLQQAASVSGRSSDPGTLSAIGWPAAHPPDKKFGEIFNPRPNGIRKNHTLADVLSMNNQPAAQAVIATLLNVLSNKVDPQVLSGRTAQSIWREMNSTKGFVPFAGAKPWSATKVTAWLATTWGGPLPANFASWA